MKKTSFKGTVRIYEGETTRLVYGYWVWQEERNCWICNGVEYGNNQCELVYKL